MIAVLLAAAVSLASVTVAPPDQTPAAQPQKAVGSASEGSGRII